MKGMKNIECMKKITEEKICESAAFKISFVSIKEKLRKEEEGNLESRMRNYFRWTSFATAFSSVSSFLAKQKRSTLLSSPLL